MKKDKSLYIIQSVTHALDLLEQFRGDVDELGVTELSKRLGLQKNNVFRLLATLEARHYIEQNRHTENYRLGLKGLELGQTVIKQMGLHRHSRPVLESLVKDCNETCYVAIQKGQHVFYLDAVESAHPVRVIPRVGVMLPVYCTAAGKVLLASVTDQEQPHYARHGRLKKHAPHTITDRLEFQRHLEMIAAQGYALEDEELDEGVRGVAAPIRDYTRSFVGAISVSGPTMRFSDARMQEELVPLVKKAADEISLRLGFSSPVDLMKTA